MSVSGLKPDRQMTSERRLARSVCTEQNNVSNDFAIRDAVKNLVGRHIALAERHVVDCLKSQHVFS